MDVEVSWKELDRRVLANDNDRDVLAPKIIRPSAAIDIGATWCRAKN